MVVLVGVEPTTFPLSTERSNHWAIEPKRSRSDLEVSRMHEMQELTVTKAPSDLEVWQLHKRKTNNKVTKDFYIYQLTSRKTLIRINQHARRLIIYEKSIHEVSRAINQWTHPPTTLKINKRVFIILCFTHRDQIIMVTYIPQWLHR